MSPRILVIDDDTVNLELVEGRLESGGYTSALCETAYEGLERARSEAFQAVLLDLRLPDMNGMEVLEILRRELPALPVLIMTAHGSEAIAVRALMAGAAGYLIKPIGRKELLEALNNALGAAQADAVSLAETTSAGERRMRAVLEAIGDGVALVAADGRIEAANGPALALMRRTEAPATMATLWEAGTVVEDPAGLPAAWPFGPDGPPASTELTVRWPDGTVRAIALATRPIDGPDGWVVTWRDVTAQRERRARLESLLDQQAAALSEARDRLRSESEEAAASVERMKRSLLSTVSHELRTPLNFIVGFGSVLADGVLGELTNEQATLLGKMLFGAERLTEMVEELLDAAMLAAGMLAPLVGEVAIAPLAEAAVSQARARAEGAGLSLEFVPGDAPPARADAEYVAKIVRQLLDNALKFTGPGGHVRVTAEAHPTTGEPSIVVDDTGPGIAPEDIPRLYERFVQLDGTATRRYGGFGLGLSTAKGLAEALGGRLELESELGRGSRFRLVVPPAR